MYLQSPQWYNAAAMWHIPLLLFSIIAAESEGEIAFVEGRDIHARRVAVVDLGSGNVTPIGPGAYDGAPVWSPDGAWLAFPSGLEPASTALYVAPADGAGSRRLTHAAPPNRDPSWSPDGTRLAYTIGSGSGRRIIVYDLASDTETAWNARSGLMEPAWLSNTELVAPGLPKEEEGSSMGLYVVTADAIAPLPTGRASRKPYVAWGVDPHPHGGGLAFESNDGGDREIFALSLTRRLIVDVSNHRAADWNPSWSPNGQWIAFESFRGGRRGVWRAIPERLLVVPLAYAPDSDNWAPTWSPCGRWVAFVSSRSGEPRLYVTDLDGGEAHPVTTGPGRWENAPAWRPETRQ